MENLTDILNIDPNAKVKDFKKGEMIQLAGSSKASTFYVKKGLLRSYIVDSKGKEFPRTIFGVSGTDSLSLEINYIPCVPKQLTPYNKHLVDS